MVRRAERSNGGAVRRKRRPECLENPGLKRDKEFSRAAKRALAFRRFWLFLLTAVLLAVGLLSVCGVSFF